MAETNELITKFSDLGFAGLAKHITTLIALMEKFGTVNISKIDKDLKTVAQTINTTEAQLKALSKIRMEGLGRFHPSTRGVGSRELNRIIREQTPSARDRRLQDINRLAETRRQRPVSRPAKGQSAAMLAVGGGSTKESIALQQQHTKAIIQTTGATKGLASATKTYSSATREANTGTKKFDQNIGVAIGKLIRYRVAFYAMRGAIEGVRDSLTGFADLQFELTGLEKVIDRQRESISGFKQEALGLSKAFGEPVKDIVRTMKVWAQTGLDQNAVNEATKATLIGVNAIGLETKQVVEALTAAIFTYGVEAEDVTSILSKWLVVQKEFPITAQDLANSLKIVGAAAQVVGVDLDDLAGYVAAIGASTRKSGAAIGQSLKTIFARLPRKEVITVFESLGIAVLKNATELRDLDNVLADLSKKWGTLSSVTKANLSTTLGGIRRYADFIALMDNYDIKLNAVIQAQKATTEAFEASDMQLATLQKSWAQTSAVIGEFSLAVGQVLAGPITTLLKGFKSLSKFMGAFAAPLAKIVGAFVTFTSVVTVLTIASVGLSFILGQISKKYKEIVASSAPAVASSTLVSLGFKGITTSAATATVSVRGLTAALGTFNVVIGVFSIAIGLLAAGWALFGGKASDASGAIEKLEVSLEQSYKRTRDNIKGLRAENEFLDDIPEKLERIAQKIQKLTKNTPEQVETYKKLNDTLKLLPKGFGPINDAIIDFNANVKDGIVGVEGITKALDEYKKKNEELAKQLEITSEVQKQSAIARNQETIEEIRSALRQLKNVQDVFRETIEGDLPKTIPLKIGLDFGQVIIEKDFLTILEESLAGGSILLLDRTLDAATKKITDNLEKKRTEINTLFEEMLRPGEAGLLKISEKDIAQGLESFDAIFDRVLKNFNEKYGLNVGELLKDSKSLRDEFTALFLKEVDTVLKTSVSALQIKEPIEQLISDLNIAIRETEEATMRLLAGSVVATDASQLIGVKPPSAILKFDETIRGLLVTLDTLADEYEILKKTLKFGEVLDFEDFKSSEGAQIVEKFAKVFQGINNEIEKNIKERETLLLVLSKLEKTSAEDITQDKRDEAQAWIKDQRENGEIWLQDLINREDDATGIVIKGIAERDKAIASGQQLQSDSKVKKTISDLLKLFNERRDLEQKYFRQILKTQGIRKLGVATLESQIEVFSRMDKKELGILGIEKQIEAIRHKGAQRIISLTIPAAEKQTASIAEQKKHHENILKILEKERNIKLDKIFEKAAVSAMVLQDALQEGFENIPTNILEGAEARRDLSRELRKAEFELSEARREGDKESIAQAQYRVDLVEYEMKKYTDGWRTVKQTISDIFIAINEGFWEQFTEDVAENISGIEIGKKAIGKHVGNAILRASATFAQDFSKAATTVNETFMTKFASEIDRWIKAMEKIYGIDTKALPATATQATRRGFRGPQDTIEASGADIMGQTERDNLGLIAAEAKKQTLVLTDIEGNTEDDGVPLPPPKETSKLIDAVTGLTTLIGSAFIQSKFTDPNANIGAQFGSMFGAGILGDKTKGSIGAGFAEALGSLGFLAGPIGGVAGGLLGGLIGGLFGGDDEPEEPLIRAVNANTDAQLSNTIALKELDKAIFNAPTGFNVPAAGGGSFGRSVTIQIMGGNTEDIVNQVRSVLFGEGYIDDERSSGTRGYVPI